MTQLTLNLQDRITIGKKTARLAVPCSDDFMGFLDKLADIKKTTRAELAFMFIVEGMQKSLGEVFMIELNSDKRLSELLTK